MARLRRMIYQRGAVGHIYQRARSGFVVFYSVKDSLVFFTIFSLTAAKHRIRVLGLCLMYNHIHVLVEAEDHKAIARFMQELCSKFSRTYNIRHGLKGSLFSTYGLSNKRGGKQIRTSLAYLYNNPVEDRICKRAEEWHWNFLAYANSDHPYSEKLVLREAAVGMRKAARTVRTLHAHQRPLTYKVLDDLFKSLNINEKKQLVDFIVREYSVIDFKSTISYYGSYGNMLTAFSSNTGSEYDICEPHDPYSGMAYRKMTHHLASDKRFSGIEDVLQLPAEERIAYLNELAIACGVSLNHARKFLRIEAVEDTVLKHRR
ncbi:MAG TPA: hypothetical protein DIT75_06180 [Rikenellaceae bacterium]|nr:hypothetical protein [Rikenellaceae bacterium]